MSLIIGYPGIQQPVSVRYTRGHGTRPGHAILEFLPQATAAVPATGTLTIGFGSSGINLPLCRADFGSLHTTPSGQTMFVKLLDRRWAWHAGDDTGQPAGEISGRYNVRRVDGTIDPTTERTPQQLAALLFNAMGEGLFDVSQLPLNPRPYVDWDYSHPASELDRLCNLLGCRVALRISTNTPMIVRLGYGAALPTANLYSVTQNWDLAEAPDYLKVVGSEALFQSKLRLRAVGLDTDGRWRLIDNLSYRPAGGWGGVVSPFSSVSGTTARALANATIWRAYQIYSQADGSQIVPSYTNVATIDNIKPINRYLVETYTDPSGRVIPQPAYVEGVWFPGGGQGPGANTSAGTRYNRSFSIDTDDGIVRFSDEVYQITNRKRAEAEMYLTCSYQARDPVTLAFTKYIQTRNLGGTAGTGPKIIRREDISFAAYANYNANNTVANVVTNAALCQAEATAQLDATQAQYFGSIAFEARYNGIAEIDIDGLTRQVTFKIDTQDRSRRGGAETYASVNTETDPYVPRYSQRSSTRQIPSGIVPRRRYPRP